MDKPIILIVDDNPQNLQLLAKVLNGNVDCNPVFATNGAAALEVSKQLIPNLILLDIMMPDMSGLEVCSILKNDEKTKNIPIVFITALAEETQLAEGFKIGGEDYITKPIRQQEVLSRVKLHLDRDLQRRMLMRSFHSQRTFQRILCHDLLNPVGLAYSIMDILPELSETEKIPVLADCQALLKNALEIISSVSERSKLQEGLASIDLADLEISELVEKSLKNLELKIKQKDITIKNKIFQGATAWVEPLSFVHSVIANLITNAIKFSERGGVIDLFSEIHPNANSYILHIQDYGTGMTEEDLDSLRHFGRLNSRLGTEQEQGTGYGLPLVFEYVRAFGGSIAIDSNQDAKKGAVGTKFSITLALGSSGCPADSPP